MCKKNYIIVIFFTLFVLFSFNSYAESFQTNNSFLSANIIEYHDEISLVSALGDVEIMSGSYNNGFSFETDWDGTLTNGKFTASVDFGNEAFIQTSTCVGLRPLGTTTQLKYSGSVEIGAGKFIDEGGLNATRNNISSPLLIPP